MRLRRFDTRSDFSIARCTNRRFTCNLLLEVRGCAPNTSDARFYARVERQAAGISFLLGLEKSSE